MKKIMLSIAIVLSSMIAFSASAKDNSDNTKEKTERQEKKKKGKAPEINPFEGLNLTEQQQADLDALKPTKEDKKADKKAKREDMKEKLQNERREYLEKVKGILTADQYIQFLENSYVNNVMMMNNNPRRQGNDMRRQGPRPQGGGGDMDFNW